MKSRGKKSWVICTTIGTLLCVLLLIGRGGLEAETPEVFWHLLCDALFVPGVLLTGMGLLVIVAGEGAFDALHYGIQKLFGILRSREKRKMMPQTYFDFVRMKHKNQAVLPRALLVTGIAFLLAAGAVLVLYYRTLV
ncbi:MAG: DUF3899 domain-containing protein [Clostridia bacterium]|nr:DUF3899 domain-containing protein [Clostridia bacterium]